MNKDNILLSRSAKENLRLNAVNMMIKGRIKKTVISETLGVSYSTLIRWHNKYKEGGKKALKASNNKGGRPKKSQNNLTDNQKFLLKKTVLLEPRQSIQLSLDFGLWTVKLVQSAILKMFKKDLKRWKVRMILIEMGFSNQTPLFRAYQQNPEKVEKRLDEELPNILEEAEIEGRTVFYGDEAGFRSTNHQGKTRGIKGVTPIVKATGARFSVNAISMISPKGELRFMAYEGTFTSKTLLKFLKLLVYKQRKKMTLVLDGHPTHKTKLIKSYLEEIKHQIKIYYLPGYSPELNPDEQVWLNVHRDLKGQISANKYDLIAKVRKSLYKQQKEKNKVASYFRHPDVQRISP